MAAVTGHLDIVKLLLSRGADVNAKDRDDITSLMEAAIMNHISVVKHLYNVSLPCPTRTRKHALPLSLVD